MSNIRCQTSSGRSFSRFGACSLAPTSFSSSSFSGAGAAGGGGCRQVSSQSVSATGQRSGVGVGFGGGAGLRVAGGSLKSGLGLGGGSFSAGYGLGGGSLSAGYGLGGGSLSAGYGLGGDSLSAGYGLGGGSVMDMSSITNEKQQLQGLNNRLATYLEKVKRLETTNRELNEKLKAFTINRVQSSIDLGPYEIQINPLREQLQHLIQENSRIALAIDNARLAADDFRIKYETELAMRQSVEGDIAGLRTLKTEYETASAALLQELKSLKDERNTLGDTHQREVAALRGQMVGTVTVDLKTADTTDLSGVLAEVRSEYETVIEKNRKVAENWYTKQLEKKQAEVAMITETTVSGSSEITENRKQSLTLETQLDALNVEKANLEQRLAEVQAQYHSQIFSLSQLAGGLEQELMSIRESALQQAQEYQLLLSTKVQLEREISTYKALLEGVGEFSHIAVLESSALKSIPTVKPSVKKLDVTNVETKILEGAEILAPAAAGADVTLSSGAGGGIDTSLSSEIQSAAGGVISLEEETARMM